jgi:hypothetical protein
MAHLKKMVGNLQAFQKEYIQHSTSLLFHHIHINQKLQEQYNQVFQQ